MANWIKIARPGTLLAAICPVCIGLVGAIHHQSISILTALTIAISAISIQVLSNFINDYYDFKKGSDGIDRVGPQRAISTGEVGIQSMKIAIGIVLSVALITGAILVWKGGLPIILIGVSALLFAWLYTATRFSLSYLGIADLFVLIYFGPVASCGTYYLLTNHFIWEQALLGLGCGLISMAVLTVNNQRDMTQDRNNHKRTLIVRFGNNFGRFFYAALLLIPIAIPLLLAPSAIAVLPLIPALWLISKFWNAEGQKYNRILVHTGLYNLFYTFCVVLTILVYL